MTQDEQQRVQRIKAYVLARLRDELASAPRGAQAQLAKQLGVSGAHLSNMLSPSPTRQPGEDFRRKVAAHWGISYAQLEAFALGEDSDGGGSPLASGPAPRVGHPAPPNLAAALAAYAWMPELPEDLRLVVRAQARQHNEIGGGIDFSADEWHRVVTGLEREALALVARRMGLVSTADQPMSTPPEGVAKRTRRRA
jgi:hypothetical protein